MKKDQSNQSPAFSEMVLVMKERRRIREQGGDVTKIDQRIDVLNEQMDKERGEKKQLRQAQREQTASKFNPKLKATIEKVVGQVFKDNNNEPEGFGVTQQKVIQRCLEHGESKWNFKSKSLVQFYVIDIINQLTGVDEQVFRSFDLRDLSIKEYPEHPEVEDHFEFTLSFGDVTIGDSHFKHGSHYFDSFIRQIGVVDGVPSNKLDRDQFILYCKGLFNTFFFETVMSRANAYDLLDEAGSHAYWSDAKKIEKELQRIGLQLLRMYVSFSWSGTFGKEVK